MSHPNATLCLTYPLCRALQAMARGPHPAPHIISSGPPNKYLCGGLEKIIIVRLASLNYSKLGLLTGGAQPKSVSLSRLCGAVLVLVSMCCALQSVVYNYVVGMAHSRVVTCLHGVSGALGTGWLKRWFGCVCVCVCVCVEWQWCSFLQVLLIAPNC